MTIWDELHQAMLELEKQPRNDGIILRDEAKEFIQYDDKGWFLEMQNDDGSITRFDVIRIPK